MIVKEIDSISIKNQEIRTRSKGEESRRLLIVKDKNFECKVLCLNPTSKCFRDKISGIASR